MLTFGTQKLHRAKMHRSMNHQKMSMLIWLPHRSSCKCCQHLTSNLRPKLRSLPLLHPYLPSSFLLRITSCSWDSSKLCAVAGCPFSLLSSISSGQQTTFFIHLIVVGYFGCFQYQSITVTVTINNLLCICTHFGGYILKSEIIRSKRNAYVQL